MNPPGLCIGSAQFSVLVLVLSALCAVGGMGAVRSQDLDFKSYYEQVGCSPCQPGYEVKADCNKTRIPGQGKDTECAPCPMGKFNDRVTFRHRCVLCGECKAGDYISVPCHAANDVTCVSCHGAGAMDRRSNRNFQLRCPGFLATKPPLRPQEALARRILPADASGDDGDDDMSLPLDDLDFEQSGSGDDPEDLTTRPTIIRGRTSTPVTTAFAAGTTMDAEFAFAEDVPVLVDTDVEILTTEKTRPTASTRGYPPSTGLISTTVDPVDYAEPRAKQSSVWEQLDWRLGIAAAVAAIVSFVFGLVARQLCYTCQRKPEQSPMPLLDREKATYTFDSD